MDLEKRLEDLRQRDAIAREVFGDRGTKLRALLDSHTDSAIEGIGAAGGVPEAQVEGFFSWWVWDDYGIGTFENIDNISLRWIGGEAGAQGVMAYEPVPDAPFSFTDTTGHKITPGAFLTDGGSIPAFAETVTGIDPRGYLPAYLVHDWEYSLHHCRTLDTARDRARVDAAMMEALKTIMTDGTVAEKKRHFWAIKTALENFASLYWDADTPCSLGVS